MALVPYVSTPLTLDGLALATIDGYRGLMGASPSAASAAVGTAHAALESGNGQKMKNWNPGNRKRPPNWEGDYCQYTCDEIFDSAMAALATRLGPCAQFPWKNGRIRCVLTPPHPWTSFVSFPTAAQGFADWLELLALTDRYRNAWKRLFAGDPAGFVRCLHAAGYMTADEDVYERAVVSIAARVLPACERLLGGDEHRITDEDRDHVSGLVSLALADTIWAPERHGELAV